jgi:F-type H+-transporting ATPase subunit delta
MHVTHHTPTALAYAQSLLDLATEQNQAEPIGQELEQLRQIVEQQPGFAAYLSDPAIGDEERGRTIDRIFANQLSPLMHNFLGVLNLKDRLKLLGEIALAYDDLLDERIGKVEVDVTVAHKLSADDLEKVRQQVSQALKRDAVMHQYVDEDIIGGMILRVGDRLIDGSVRKQLQTIREQMLAARPK